MSFIRLTSGNSTRNDLRGYGDRKRCNLLLNEIGRLLSVIIGGDHSRAHIAQESIRGKRHRIIPRRQGSRKVGRQYRPVEIQPSVRAREFTERHFEIPAVTGFR